MHPFRLLLLALALALFLLAGLGVAHPRYNLTSLGLALVTATLLFP